MTKEPSEHDLFETRITLRLPGPLRDALNKAAQASTRSMNGEIVYRLEAFDLQRDMLRRADEEYSRALAKVEDLSKQVVRLTMELQNAGKVREERDALQEQLPELRQTLDAALEEIKATTRTSAQLMRGLEALFEDAARGEDEPLKKIVGYFKENPGSGPQTLFDSKREPMWTAHRGKMPDPNDALAKRGLVEPKKAEKAEQDKKKR